MAKKMYQLSVPHFGRVDVEPSGKRRDISAIYEEEYAEVLALLALGERSPVGKFVRDRLTVSSFALPMDSSAGFPFAKVAVILGSKRDLAKLTKLAYADSLADKKTWKSVKAAILPSAKMPDLSGVFSEKIAKNISSWFQVRTKAASESRSAKFRERWKGLTEEELAVASLEVERALKETGEEEPFAGGDMAKVVSGLTSGPLIEGWLTRVNFR